jgi:hypothetical protein
MVTEISVPVLVLESVLSELSVNAKTEKERERENPVFAARLALILAWPMVKALGIFRSFLTTH